ncbi:hypothetical protein [Pseudomonas sp. zfem002]|uniref:hypothetical protein n=1 Tax=Pseudomonas sp. zfem002 TaxID=3078197 RepID=UPI0029298CFC|nr:hypothetical protein [Pseudomonas sp. zfem002]MDU9392898.1 hypothetical protein [Pseudomonas sp. zfem002]
MSKLHAYSTDARNRLKVLSCIAAIAYGITAAISYIIPRLLEIAGLDAIYIIGLYSLVFLGIYWIYDKKAWVFVGNDIPDLGGTWMGCTLPNYQRDWPHLAIVTIEQNWSEIYIHEDAFFKNASAEPWDLDKRLGYNESIVAALKDNTAERSDLCILYEHIGLGKEQPNFKGSYNLLYLSNENKLVGNYFTNRSVSIHSPEGLTRKEGSQGPLILRRISNKILTTTEALATATESNAIKQIEAEIMKRKI